MGLFKKKKRKTNWFAENKHKYFDFDDWTDPQDNYRFEKDVKKLSYKEWFWLHPSAYNLISYGINVIALLIWVPAAFFSFMVGFFIAGVILTILSIFNLIYLKNKIKNHDATRYLTFYDLYMREYPDEDLGLPENPFGKED